MPDDPNLPDKPTGNSDATPPPIESLPGNTTPSQPNPAMPLTGGTLPQGTVPPPGYPPTLGNMPPSGYPPPFTGNVPPGSVPPGYPPPQYFMPMEFPPPPAYAVPPPYRGYPWEVVPPAPGNLVQAWFAIATNFSRRAIAARAQASQPDWTAWSIGVGVILAAIAGVVNGIRLINITAMIPAANDPQSVQFNQTFQNIFTGEAIATLIITPLSVMISVFLLPWFWSFFMTPLLGSSRQRFQRAFRAFALIQPILSAVALIEALISLMVSSFVPTIAPLVLLLSILFLAYTTALNIQAGSVGSGLKRWPVFGIQLLAGVATEFVFVIVGIIGVAIFIAIHSH